MKQQLTCQNCECVFDCDLDDLNNYKVSYTRRGSRGQTFYMSVACPRCDLKILSFQCSENKYNEIKNNIQKNKIEQKNIEEQLAELKEYQNICSLKDFKALKEFYETMSTIDWANTKTINIKAEDYPTSICSEFSGDIILNL